MRKIRLMTVIILILALCLSGCGNELDQTPDNQDKVETDASKQEPVVSNDPGENKDEEVVTNEEPEIHLKTGPFTGKLYQELQLNFPIMAMIENSPAARPQTGLEEASIIYEYLTEGGITRFLALYYERFPETIGPIRSTRSYFIVTALEYEALLLHAGASPDGFALLESSGIEHLDELSNGSKFWRDPKRRPPHNLYTGLTKLTNELAKEVPEEKIFDESISRFPFQMVGFINRSDYSQATDVKITYWGGYTVGYKYDENKGNYLRFIDGLPHLMEGGKKLYAYNILIQYVDTKVKDDQGRLNMDLIGSNKALLFKDGFVTFGSWVKDEGERTRFLDSEGNEWSINPGQTWIQVVPLTTKVDYH